MDFDRAPATIVMGGVYSIRIEEYIEKIKESAKVGYAIIKNGGTAVEAIEKSVSILESSDLFMIGRGSPLNSEGEVECDAMIMDGDTLNTGAVISGRNFKTPVCENWNFKTPIMEETPHCALSGDGALNFALSTGFPCCSRNELINKQKRLPPEYFNDYARYFMEGGSVPDISPDISPEEAFNGDTACAAAIDRYDTLACATSTGGIAGKLKGRVSDTALVGCGGYANHKGAAAATVHGEKLIKFNFTRQVVFDMEAGSAQVMKRMTALSGDGAWDFALSKGFPCCSPKNSEYDITNLWSNISTLLADESSVFEDLNRRLRERIVRFVKVFNSSQDLTDIKEYRYLKNAIRALKVPKALQAKDVPSEKHQRLKKELMERKMERYKEVLDALWKRDLLLYKDFSLSVSLYGSTAVKSTNVVPQDEFHITHEDAAANLAQDDEIIAQDEPKINGLTVNLTKSSKNLTKEIHDVHGIQTLKSKEFWLPLPIEAPFRLLSNIEIPHDGNQNGGAFRGTITLICQKDGVYSALTCAHVACASDYQQTFLDGERVVSISKAVQTLNKHDENKYMYTPSKSDCKAEIGSTHRHTFAQFDSETDIMSINIGKQEDFKKLFDDEMEDVVLNLDDANLELQRRVEDNKEAVKVRTGTGVEGFISELNYKYWCKNSTRRIFQNAIKIKSCQTFLDSGDSGTLVWFLDEKNNWQPFAYGVSEILDDGGDGPGKSYICLKLDRALEALGLENGQFFRLRDNAPSLSNSAKRHNGHAVFRNTKRNGNNHATCKNSEVVEMSLKLKRQRVPMDLNEGNYNILAVEKGDIQEPTLKKSRTDQRLTKAKEEIVYLEKYIEFREHILEIAKTQQQQPEDLPQPPEKANHDDNFHKLLDKSKNIKADVHEALQSCSWLSGKYGIARPNKKMPFPHLYVTVDFKKENSKDAIKNEIDKKLKWKASKYIELRSKPLKEAKFRMLSKIIAQRTQCSSGTLTMFCLKNGMYYALTCAHAGVVNNLDNRQQQFSDRDQFMEIKESLNAPINEKSMEYFYNEQQIGPVSDKARAVSNKEVDIMYIVIGGEEDFQKITVDNKKTLNLDLEGANEEIYEKIHVFGKNVIVRTADAILGVIRDWSGTYWCPGSNKVIFQNAVIVQNSNQSIDSGDSGALVYFLNKENNWKPFAYVVAEYCPDSSRPRKSYICLKLDKALNGLNLNNAEYFTDHEPSNLPSSHQPDEK